MDISLSIEEAFVLNVPAHVPFPDFQKVFVPESLAPVRAHSLIVIRLKPPLFVTPLVQ